MQVGAPQQKKWTVLVWSCSENDLHAYQLNDLDEAEKVGSTDTFQMVAQVDHESGAQRLEIQRDVNPGLSSPVKQEMGPLSMARPENLSDFIEWGMKNYPAENYWLVISDHGDAWKGACEDDGAEDWMSLPEIQQALQSAREATGRKLDVLSFDACYMGSLEVAHQLRHEASYMVASEEMVGYYGLPYDQLLQNMDHSPRELAQHIVEMGQGDPNEFATSSAIDLSKVGALSDAVKDLGQAIVASRQDLSRTSEQTQSFWQYKDVFHLAQQVEAASGEDENLRRAAQSVQKALGEAVIAEQHASTHPDAHGLQIELDPQAARRTEGWSYGETAFAADTGWALATERLRPNSSAASVLAGA